MKKNLFGIRLILIFSAFTLFIQKTKGQVNLQWPCGQYVTRQELVSGTTYKSVINVLYTNPSGTVGLDKVCENTSYLFNAAVFFNGYIWAWKQYTGTAQTGSSNKLIKLNNDCTVTEYTMSITGAYNNAYVDNAGNMYIGNPGTAPNFSIYKINLNTLTTSGTNAVTTISATPAITGQGYTSYPGGFGDMYFDGSNAYIWNNQQGLARIDYNAAGTAATYTRIGTGNTNETVGSLFINAAPSESGYLYGYGSSAAAGVGNSPQNTIVKIKLSDGTYSDVAAGGASVSQSDGAGCPTATFEEPKPVANPDESLNNPNGSTITVSPITGNDVVVGGTIDKTTVNIIAPPTATDIITNSQGYVTSMLIPEEGTWMVNSTTGDITFQPLASFTGNPTPIYYNVKDDKGNLSNDTTVTITYLETLPIEIINFSASIVENDVNIFWKTSNDKNFSYFELFSSENLNEFTSIGKVDFNGGAMYNFKDNVNNYNEIVYYRLKLVDNNGSYKYSKTISVKLKDSEYVFVQNPVSDGLLKLKLNFKNHSIVLLNSLGQKYNISTINTGNNSFAINVNNIPNGLYFLMVMSDKKIITKKVLIQN